MKFTLVKILLQFLCRLFCNFKHSNYPSAIIELIEYVGGPEPQILYNKNSLDECQGLNGNVVTFYPIAKRELRRAAAVQFETRAG